MKIKIDHNFPDVAKAMHELAKQVPFALAKALTKTAQDVRDAQKYEITKVFDRPTSYTRNSIFMEGAKKTRLEAKVWLKGEYEHSDRRHYLVPQILGGDRPLKRFERRLVQNALMRSDERAVPASGAKLDSYGNVSRGQIIKILSQLQATTVVGDYSGASNSRRSRAKRAKEGYFVSRGLRLMSGKTTEHLPRGIWMRRSFGPLGTAVKPVFLFVNRARYKARYKFFELANTVIDKNFAENWRQSWADALRTAR